MSVFLLAGRELRAILGTTIGWLVLAGFLFVVGFFWSVNFLEYVARSASVVNNPYAASQMSLTTHLTGPWFGNVTVILVLITPALTMRLLAEEYQRGTIELLLTSPVSSWEIVLGKFLGAIGFLATMLLGTAYVPLTLLVYGTPDPGPLLAGYLMLLLLGGTTIAIGLFVSSMTENPIVALVVGFCLALFVYLLPWLDSSPDSVPALLGMSSHVRELLGGRLVLSDLVYFLGLCAVLLLAAQQRVESRRWA